MLDVFSRFLRNTNTSSPKWSAKCRNLLELLQSEPWLRKLFDCCFCGASGFLCLLPNFPEWKEEFSPVVLSKPCNSLGACFGWCEPLGMCWGVIMPHAQREGTCADHECPCDFLIAQLWLYSLSSPLTLGWMEGEMSGLSDLSCPSSTTLTLKG